MHNQTLLLNLLFIICVTELIQDDVHSDPLCANSLQLFVNCRRTLEHVPLFRHFFTDLPQMTSCSKYQNQL